MLIYIALENYSVMVLKEATFLYLIYQPKKVRKIQFWTLGL